MQKSWRRIWIFGLLFSILNFSSYSNDWEFGSRGEHMLPFQHSKMKIKDEKIMMKLEEDKSGDFRMKVKVRFVFENEEEGKKIIGLDRKSTRLNSSHANISYAVFCLKK